MKIYEHHELEAFQSYFFVYNGLVHYGYIGYPDWVKPGEYDYHDPDCFFIKNDRSTKEDGYEFCCNSWDAELIYTLG